MWVYVIKLTISLIISYAINLSMQKKGRKILPQEVDVPTAEEGIPIPVVFGKVKLTSPNVVWYGNLDTAKIKSDPGK